MNQDRRGLELTTGSPAAAAAFDRSVERYLEYRLDSFDHLKASLQEDPDFWLAQCLKGYFGMLMGTVGTRPMVRDQLALLAENEAGVTEREQLHGRALRAWYEGDLVGASAAWDRILFAWPHDILALRLQHFNHFWMGRSEGLRCPVAGVMPSWDEKVPGYGYLLAMHAFGLEECGDLPAAEAAGRRSVELNPDDLWGVHAVAHVLEVQGRLEEGRAWMQPPENGWEDRNAFRGHLWWHGTLFALEQGRYEEVLETYDRAVKPRELVFYIDLQNSASLLARLEFAGVDVGNRWQELAVRVRPLVDDHVILFTDLHNMVTLARSGDRASADQLLESLERFASEQQGYEAELVEGLIAPVARGILAFYSGDPSRCVDLLLPLRHTLQPMGGSHTQRDVFQQLLLEASLAAGRLDVARHLAAERIARRPNSVGNWHKYSQVASRLGDVAGETMARARAERAALA